MPLIRRPSPPPPAPAAEPGDPFFALTDGDPAARRRAARALAGLPGGVAALGRAAGAEPDSSVREAIFTSLARAAGRESVEAVLVHLRSDDAALRTAALDALRAMPDAVRPLLPVLLADPDADVRLLVCEVARGLAPEDASPLMTALLERETEVNVCAAAVEVLAEVGDADSAPALRRCAERFAGEPFLGFAIEAAIAQMAPPASPRA